MRDCNEYQKLISCMLDDELSPEESAMLLTHIDGCDDCRSMFIAFKGMSEAMSGDLYEPPEELADGIMYKIALEHGNAPRKRFSWGSFTAMAACLALILIGSRFLPSMGGGAASRSENSESAADQASLQQEFRDEADTSQFAAGTPAPDAPAEEPPRQENSGYGDSGDSELVTGAGSVSDADFETGVTAMGEISEIEIYSAAPEENTPVLTTTDEETLVFLLQLIEFSEPTDEEIPASDPAFLLKVVPSSGDDAYLVRLWVIDGQLLCELDGEMYISAGDISALFELIADS